ncbi:MAG: hypothetical protein LBP85_05185 [Prevotellaceae bacterium]|nr:hypothetical protein [Prevotellaceae bacterium]
MNKTTYPTKLTEKQHKTIKNILESQKYKREQTVTYNRYTKFAVVTVHAINKRDG